LRLRAGDVLMVTRIDRLTAGSEQVPIDHTDRRVEVRVDVCMSGKFALANNRDAKGDRRKFACRATNISQSAILLLTPIAGAIGERVIAYFEEFGELNGFAVRFKEIQDLAGLERMIIHDWADEAAGPMPLFAIRDHALDR
jgi:hypothetical protein